MLSINHDIRIKGRKNPSMSIIAGVALASLVVSLFASLVPFTVSAAESTFKSPTDVDSVASAWNDANDAFTSNNDYTNTNNDNAEQGYDEFGGFSLPSGATINGILVEADALQQGTSCQLGVALSWNNGSSFTSYKEVVPTSSESTVSFGGASDTWGRSWTLSNLSNSNFVLKIRYDDPGSGCGSSDDIYVDVIRVKVFYTPLNAAPTITLNGSANVSINVGGTYVEDGATANDAEDGDISGSIQITGSVNTGAVGTYTLTYSVTDSGGASDTETRIVTVSDVTAPVVIITPGTQTIEALTSAGAAASYTVSATDDVDGDVTASTTCNIASGSVFPIGNTTITCTAVDSSSQTGSGSATVIVENKAPVITLNGSATVTLTVGDTYNEEGATATDTIDGSVSVTIGGDTVDTANAGTYVVTYDAEDAQGNDATQVTRTVVVNAPAQQSNNNGGGGGGGGVVASGPLAPGFVNTNPTSGSVLGTTTTAGSTGGEVLGASTELPAGCTATFTGYLKKGSNDSEAIKKLQAFLNKHLGLSLPVSGVFGPMTFDAVSAFQVKYSDEILKPWFDQKLSDNMDPSGYAYKMTMFKINKLECETLNAPVPQLP